MRAIYWGALTFGVGASLVALGLHPGARRVRLPIHAQPVTFFHEGQQALQVGMLPTGVKGLDAASCAKCHAGEHSDWAGSPHAHAATEPVFAAAFKSEPRALCRSCHSPLEEQQPVLVQTLTKPPTVLLNGRLEPTALPSIIEPNPRYNAKLSTEGVNCVTCHVREGTVLTANATALPAPHPLSYSPMMREPSYCAGCHQFEVKNPSAHPFETASSKAPSSGGLIAPGVRLLNAQSAQQRSLKPRLHTHLEFNGAARRLAKQDVQSNDPEQPPVPSDPGLEMQYQQEARVQETLQEFRTSPAAARGETCQSCHMPSGKDGRRHLFAGSGSLEMLRKAISLTARLDRPTYSEGDRLNAEITLQNDAGHRFPTGDSVHAGILDVWLRDGKRTLGRQLFVMTKQRDLPPVISFAGPSIPPQFSALSVSASKEAILKGIKRQDTRLDAGETAQWVYQQKVTSDLRRAASPELVVRVYHAGVHPGFRGSGIDPGQNTLKLIREERLPVRLAPGPRTATATPAPLPG